jgi:hypothetical protein
LEFDTGGIWILHCSQKITSFKACEHETPAMFVMSGGLTMSCCAFLSHAIGRSNSSDGSAVQVAIQALMLWALLWCVSLFIDPQWQGSLGLSLNEHGHASLHAHGHPFVDARSWWGIPNTLDVLSNVPMLGVGLWGAWRIHRILTCASQIKRSAMLAFVGLVLTWAGSSMYHWHSVPETLVLDRLGMSVTFAGVLGWAVAECLQVGWAHRFAVCVMLAGGVSATLPLWIGHVLPWAVLQFGGLMLVLAHAVLMRREGLAWWTFKWPWLWLVGCYVLAKWLELEDAQVFIWTREWVSGHTLKHLTAALALIPLAVSPGDCGKMRTEQAFDRSAN